MASAGLLLTASFVLALTVEHFFSHRAHGSLLNIKCHRDPGKLRLVQPRSCKKWGISVPIPTGTAAVQANVSQYQNDLQCFKTNGMDAPDLPVSLKTKKKRKQNFWLSVTRTQMWNYQKFQLLTNFNKSSEHELNLFSFSRVSICTWFVGSERCSI